MGNARSASYSYNHHDQTSAEASQHETERHRSLPLTLQPWIHHHGVHHLPHPHQQLPTIDNTAAEEPSPLPFVRHRNAPIRLPRINITKESWPMHQTQTQTHYHHYHHYQQFVQPFGRHKSLSCSIMQSAEPESAATANPFSSGGVGGGECPSPAAIVPSDSNLSLGRQDRQDTDARNGSQKLRSAVSCAALLVQSDESRFDRSSGRRLTAGVNNNNSNNNRFGRRQFLSMRSYHYPVLSEMNGSSRNYLELARLKKQSLEQSLTGPDVEDDDEDGGYTTTLTLGDNASLRSDAFSDCSYLTLLTANTSLSSGYHGPASLGEPLPVSSDVTAAAAPAATSGLFDLEWLRQVAGGTVPSYIELRQGRLHLKLIQGQSVHSPAIRAGHLRTFSATYIACFIVNGNDNQLVPEFHKEKMSRKFSFFLKIFVILRQSLN